MKFLEGSEKKPDFFPPTRLEEGTQGNKPKNGSNTVDGVSWCRKEAGFFMTLLATACFPPKALALAFPFSCYFSPEILPWPDLYGHSVLVTSSEGLFMLPPSLTSHYQVMLSYFLYITVGIICICLFCLAH